MARYITSGEREKLRNLAKIGGLMLDQLRALSQARIEASEYRERRIFEKEAKTVV